MRKDRLVAIVDDDKDVREAIKALMRSMGFAAEAFASGHDFLSSPQVNHTVCLIADMNMPEMTGLDLHYRLAELGEAIPTILITAYPTDEVRSLAFEAGVIAYLVKPFLETDLLSGVRVAFARREQGG